MNRLAAALLESIARGASDVLFKTDQLTYASIDGVRVPLESSGPSFDELGDFIRGFGGRIEPVWASDFSCAPAFRAYMRDGAEMRFGYVSRSADELVMSMRFYPPSTR